MRDTSSGRMRTGVTGLALAVMVACVMFRAESGIARTYSFDAAMLKGGGKGVDLTLFEEGGQLPGIYPV
ncbi:hypothetical protein NQ279_25780, partial [Escherichia coli]|nr:hypothetical protein [Escherichia coli]